MGDEYDRLRDRDEKRLIPEPPARDAVLRRNDPEHLTLLSDMREVKEQLHEYRSSQELLVRQVSGSWDDDNHRWRPGLVQDMQTLVTIAKWFGGIITVLLTTLTGLAISNWMHISGGRPIP